jgi:hypothetical protein
MKCEELRILNFYNGNEINIINIDYVHQIQNLYFTIKQKELIIKT